MKKIFDYSTPSPSDITTPTDLLLSGHTIIWPRFSRYVLQTDSIIGNEHFLEEKVYWLEPGARFVLWLTDDFKLCTTPKPINTEQATKVETHHEFFELTFPDPDEKTHYPLMVKVPENL